MRRANDDASCLRPNPEGSYPAGQTAAAELRAQNFCRIIFPSARKSGGICPTVFHPHSVQNVRPAARRKPIWDGSPEFIALGLFGFLEKR
ncbi:MAG: RES domain-containing protein [Alphaproteobacteria bacterium]